MSSYERSGVVVDQCTECRGLFLDRGELERLLDVAGGAVGPGPDAPQFSAPAPDRSWRPAPPQQRSWNQHDWDDDSDSDRRHSGSSGHAPYKKKKRHSMLKEFLDF